MNEIVHVGLPIATAGAIRVGDHVYIGREKFVVVKVGGAAFDMLPMNACNGRDDCPVHALPRGWGGGWGHAVK